MDEVRKGLLVEEVRIQVADCWDEVVLGQSLAEICLQEMTVPVSILAEEVGTDRRVHWLADTQVNV